VLDTIGKQIAPGDSDGVVGKIFDVEE